MRCAGGGWAVFLRGAGRVAWWCGASGGGGVGGCEGGDPKGTPYPSRAGWRLKPLLHSHSNFALVIKTFWDS